MGTAIMEEATMEEATMEEATMEEAITGTAARLSPVWEDRPSRCIARCMRATGSCRCC